MTLQQIRYEINTAEYEDDLDWDALAIRFSDFLTTTYAKYGEHPEIHFDGCNVTLPNTFAFDCIYAQGEPLDDANYQNYMVDQSVILDLWAQFQAEI